MYVIKEWIFSEIKEEIKNYIKTNEPKHPASKYLWDTATAVLKGKIIVVQAYLKKQEKSQLNSLTLYLKEQTNPRDSRRKEITNIKAEINHIEIKNNAKNLLNQ